MPVASRNTHVKKPVNRAILPEKKRSARRDALILEHLPLVRSIACRIRETLPEHLETDDLIHAGILGLIDAAGKYISDKKIEFSCYARHRIKGAILDSLRDLDCASRHLRRSDRELQAATRDFSAEMQRTPTQDELAERLGIGVDKCRRILSNIQSCKTISAEAQETQIPELAGAPETHPDKIFAWRQRQAKLGWAMKTLPERYKRVLGLYYNHEMTMKEIGLLLGINESRVSQIHRIALARMSAALRKSGIRSSKDL